VNGPPEPRTANLAPASEASQTRPPLVFQSVVGVPPEAVFDAFFRQPERWLCRDGSSVEAQPGGRLRLCWPDGCIEGRFLQFEPPRSGRFTWRFEGDDMPETMVVVSAEPAEREGRPCTALEVEHYGFGVGPDWDMLYVGAARAWAAYLKNLRAVLEVGLDLREADE
jgi:uncharacterized protein YndB with AHSA1/START domain